MTRATQPTLDVVNNPTISIYDGLDNTGIEKMPTTEYDAETRGNNGFMPKSPIICRKGIYIEIATAGSVEVVPYYKPRSLWGID